MTTKIKIYIACVAVFAAATVATALWSDHKLAQTEREVKAAKTTAAAAETRSRELENAAAEYKEKIDYLEGSLSDLKRIAEQQNEQIRSLEIDTGNARRNADRARTVRSVTSTAAELCRKLAELDHPCE